MSTQTVPASFWIHVSARSPIIALSLGMAIALLAAQHAAAAPRLIKMPELPWNIDGKPILGTYNAGSLEDLQRVKAVGMNVVLGDDAELDPSTEVGAYCQENGIKVLYHVTAHLYHGVRLREPVTQEQTDIPLYFQHGRPKAPYNIIQLDDELIRYETMTEAGLVNCERGYGGTAPAAHREGIILCWPEAVEADVARIKDSPNLGGYYVLDDSPGDSVSALRAMYQAIRRLDPAEHGRPVCAGFGDAGAMVNLAPGVCDIMCFYWYPVSTGNRYDRERTSREVQHMLAAARGRVPGIPFVGIYQAFDGAPASTGQGVPTPEQLREQLEDFVRDGAAGLISYTCNAGDILPGWAQLPELAAVIKTANEEILRTGGLLVRPETELMQRYRIQPEGHWDTPLPVPGVPPAWHVVGPFDDTEGKMLQADFPPDAGIELAAVYPVKFGTATWRVRETTTGVLPLTALFGPEAQAIIYATCEISSPVEQTVQMRVCSDDDAWIQLNGREVFRFEGSGGMDYDKYIVPVKLPAGKSRLLAKVYNRKGMWGLNVRFTDTQGRPLEGVTFSPQPHRE